MICYYFPPFITSGAARSVGFSENLPAFGWEPIVFSAKDAKDPWEKFGAPIPPGIRIVRSPEWNLAGAVDFLNRCTLKLGDFIGKRDRTSNIWRDAFCVPDAQIAWRVTGTGTALARESDLIYVSCSPFSSALRGVKIKQKTNKPLVLDFRDAWSLNPYAKYKDKQYARIRAMERKAIDSCDHLILNTPGTLRLYLESYPEHEKKMSVIPNGYDELTPVTATREPNAPFRIMHVGSFYRSRSPRLLLEALTEMTNIPSEFVQVGGDFRERQEFEGRLKIEYHPTMPREKALEMMGAASLLYLKQGFEDHVSNYIAVAAKTYEYLATGLPILADIPPGDNADLVRNYATSAEVVTSNNKEDIKAALGRAYAARNTTPIAVNEEFARKFSRRNLSSNLADVFNSVVNKKTTPKA